MDFKIITKSQITIITVTGDMGKESREGLLKCAKETLETDSKAVLIYFKGLNQFDPSLLREFTLFQHELRKKNVRIKIVGLSLPMKVHLSDKGVLRSNEVHNDLNEALKQLSKAIH